MFSALVSMLTQRKAASDDHEDARQYMLDVARGDARAQYRLGTLFQQGRGGLPQDEREAVRLFKLAAEQGFAAARCMLGGLYARGEGGLPRDDRQAARLFALAADQGDASAQCDLGVFYEGGRGGLTQNDREAARLFKLAADHGVAAAQYNLGLLYAEGRGDLPRDHSAAVRLWKLAADQGLVAARTALEPRLFARLFGGAPASDDAPRPLQEEDRRNRQRQTDEPRREEPQGRQEAGARERQTSQPQQDRQRPVAVGAMSAVRAFEILGIEPGSSPEDIHAAYSRLMKRVHPDLGGSAYFTKELNAARAALLDRCGREGDRA